jgi:hypothetical protein
MTAHTTVTDDTLGQIAKRQWELFRRVKDGSLDPNQALSALQGIIENEADLLEIEKLGWRVSSQVYEIDVEKGTTHGFPVRVKELGFKWRAQDVPPQIPGGNKHKGMGRFRLAQITRNGMTARTIKVYAELSGFDLATAEGLLSFMAQCPVMATMPDDTYIVALGNHAYWRGLQDPQVHAFLCVTDYVTSKGRVWAFDTYTGNQSVVKSPEDLDRVSVYSGYHVLLRERGQ